MSSNYATPLVRGKQFKFIDNYVYIYQLNKYVILPVYPEELQDSLGSTFEQTNILSRTAPIFSYSHSGPRSINVNLKLHRDMMNDVNYNNLEFMSEDMVSLSDDYVDTLIKYLQAMALPAYAANDISSKMINPPLIAVRFGNEVFIKGIVQDVVTVTYSGPIGSDGKYKEVAIDFKVTEVDPQDAETIVKWGSFRGLESALTKKLRNQ